MSSIVTSNYDTVNTMLTHFSNEIIAVSLFSIGYWLFKFFSQKKPDHATKKQTQVIDTIQKTKDQSTLLYRYNLFIRDTLAEKPGVNPFEILEQMQKEGLNPDITSYNTLLDIVLGQENYELGTRLFNEMRDSLCPIKADIITYNTFIKGLSLKIIGLNDEAEIEKTLINIAEIKNEMESIGVIPNDITYNTYMDAAVNANNIEMSFNLFNEMQNKEIKPDIFTYSTLIKGLKRPDSFIKESIKMEKVVEIFNDIKQNSSMKVDDAIFNNVIDTCFKYNDYAKAVEIYDDLIKSKIKPSIITYGIMIKGYGQFRNLDGALQIYKKMQQENLKLNEVTLGCLVDACIKCDNLNLALEIIENEKFVKANTVIYTTLIKGFTKAKNLEKALETFESMQNKGDIHPNLVSYNSILDCCVQCKQFEKMEEIFLMVTSGDSPFIEPDIITYSTYLKGLCRSRQIDKAYDLFKELKSKKVYKLDEVLYNSMLDGLHKCKQFERVEEIYEMMMEDKIRPSNVTYSIMIKLYNSRQEIDRGLEILNKMKNEDIRPGLIVYTCLIQSCIKHKRIQTVLDLYQEMQNNNVKGDVVFYNTLISGLLFNYELKEAISITMFTLEQRMCLNPDVYYNILQNLCKMLEGRYYCKKLEKKDVEVIILQLCQSMRMHKIDINYDQYNKIASLISKNNILPESVVSKSGVNNEKHYRNGNNKPYYRGIERKK